MTKTAAASMSAAIAIAAGAVPAFADPGEHHLSLGGTLAHMLSNADHASMLAGAAVAGVALAYAVRKVMRSR